jgi:hypothetical protein
MTFFSKTYSIAASGRAAGASRALLLLAAVVGGCNLGGLNDGVRAPGDQPGGVQLALGDIAVAPDGSYFLFERGDQLAVGWVGTEDVEVLPVTSPARLAFAQGEHVVYVTTELGELHAVDVDELRIDWTAYTGMTVDPKLVASKDGSRVAVGSQRSVSLYAAADGAHVADRELAYDLVDLEILPDDARLLAVESHRWPTEDAPATTVHVIELEAGVSRDFEVPNCSDDIIVPKNGELALLAPTFCSKDPISYVDLTEGEEHFVRNLPGFGPVALGPDGNTAVGFLDMQALDESLFEDPNDIPSAETRYHLMVIDTDDLSYEFHAYGNELPRYAMTPDGRILLVDEALADNARLFDLESGEYQDITGPLRSFEQLGFSKDATRAYVLSDLVAHAATSGGVWMDYQLYGLDIAEGTSRLLPTTFRPRNVNVSPDDERLFLREDDHTVCIYSLATETCERTLVLAAE